MSPEELDAWLEASTEASGVPPKVVDPAVLSRVARLVAGPQEAQRSERRTA